MTTNKFPFYAFLPPHPPSKTLQEVRGEGRQGATRGGALNELQSFITETFTTTATFWPLRGGCVGHAERFFILGGTHKDCLLWVARVKDLHYGWHIAQANRAATSRKAQNVRQWHNAISGRYGARVASPKIIRLADTPSENFEG